MDWSFRYERTLSFYSTAISVLEFSQDFTKLISGNGSGDVKVWDVAQWSEVKTLRRPAEEKNRVPKCLSSSASGAIACCYPNLICVYSSPQYELALELKPPQDLGVATWRCLCFSPTNEITTGESGEDNLLAAWTETSLCVFSVQSSSVLPRLTRSVIHSSAVPRVCSFTRCGTHVVCGHEDGQIYVWNTSSFTLEKTLVGHLGAITSLSFSTPGGDKSSMLVTCSLDKALRVWEQDKGWKLVYFQSLTSIHDNQAVHSCGFNKTGSYFVTCAADLVVWKWAPQKEYIDTSGPPLIPHQKLKGCMNGMRLKAVAAGASQIAVGTIDGVLGVWGIVHESPPVQEQLVKPKEHDEKNEKLDDSRPKRLFLKLSTDLPAKPWKVDSPKRIDCTSGKFVLKSPTNNKRKQKQMYRVTENPMYVFHTMEHNRKDQLFPLDPCSSSSHTPKNGSPSQASLLAPQTRFLHNNCKSLPAMVSMSRAIHRMTPPSSCHQITRKSIANGDRLHMRRVTLEPVSIS